MASSEPENQPQINVDEDWKERVKAENRAFDQKVKHSPSGHDQERTVPQSEPVSASETVTSQLPPPDFNTLVVLLSTQAMAAFGMFSDKSDEDAKPQPALARHFIDLLGVLEQKTRGNLSNEENSLLVNTLHQLRMAYMEQMKNAGAAWKD